MSNLSVIGNFRKVSLFKCQTENFFPFMLCANGLSCRLCGSLVSEIISNHSTALNDWRTSKAESVTPNQSSIVNTLYPFIKKRNSRTIIILSSKDECHVPSAADTGFFCIGIRKVSTTM